MLTTRTNIHTVLLRQIDNLRMRIDPANWEVKSKEFTVYNRDYKPGGLFTSGHYYNSWEFNGIDHALVFIPTGELAKGYNLQESGEHPKVNQGYKWNPEYFYTVFPYTREDALKGLDTLLANYYKELVTAEQALKAVRSND